MKVTTDPASRQNIIREGAGPVTADSLAAESTRQGGGFAENRDSEPLKVKGANSTFNTTDTSAADVLPPAANAASRSDPNENYIQLGESHKHHKGTKTAHGHSQDAHDKSALKEQVASKEQISSASKDTAPSIGQEEGNQSSGKELNSGHESGQDKAGKQTAGKQEGSKHAAEQEAGAGDGGVNQAAAKTTGTEAKSSQPEVAPTYVEVDVINPPIHAKPKGANLTEGGFDSDDAQNASSNAEIGSEDDPGRVAEAQFQKVMAHTARDSGASGLKQKGITDDGQFDALPAEEEA